MKALIDSHLVGQRVLGDALQKDDTSPVLVRLAEAQLPPRAERRRTQRCTSKPAAQRAQCYEEADRRYGNTG